MRRASSSGQRAPPTWMTSRDERSKDVPASAVSVHSRARGGTRPVIVTPSRATISHATDGAGDAVRAIVPPAHIAPRMPGELIGKLCATGSVAR
ncbi:Uncharacterised protein [Mycobacteroides abscessus subsp. abscessus]|nr:Uncharacterised protein [Mycobacteroides abscessus subsp. abscessus]